MSAAASSETLPGLLAAQAAERPAGIAIRVKRLGIWREVDWQTLATVVRETALALDGIGIGAGDHVALFAANDPRWLVADLGIETVRAIPVGMQAVQDADELAANLTAAAARRDRLRRPGAARQRARRSASRSRAFERLVVFDMKGLHAPEYHEEPIVSFEDFRAAGRARHGAAPGRHAELLAAVRPDDVSIVSLHRRARRAAPPACCSRSAGRSRSAGCSPRASARGPTTAASRSCRSAMRRRACSTSSCRSSPARRSTSPSRRRRSRAIWRSWRRRVFVATPKFFERIRAEVELRAGRAGRLKRRAYGFGMRRLAAALEARRRGGSARLSAFARPRARRPLRARQGGPARVRYAGVGGAPVAPTSSTGTGRSACPCTSSTARSRPAGSHSPSAGSRTRARPECRSVRRSRPGSGPAASSRSAARASTSGASARRAGGAPDDGWYATGDLVRLDEQGRLVPLDRRSQLLTTTAGEVVSPAAVAVVLERSSYISAAVVVAEGRPFVSALLELQLEAVGDWARAREKPVTTYAALAADGDVQRLIGEQVEAANASLGEAERVGAFAITTRPLDDELTATGTVAARARARALRDADRGPLRRPGRRRRSPNQRPTAPSEGCSTVPAASASARRREVAKQPIV